MNRILAAAAGMASAALLVASAAYAQQDSHTSALGATAREQRELRKQRQKTTPPVAVHTDDEIATTGSDGAGKKASPSPADSPAKPQPLAEEGKSLPSGRPRPVLDRPQDSAPDMIVVPAGTELRVDIHQHKVVVPVRVGFATPIPALSQVAVEVSRTYVNTPYSATAVPYVDYVEYATVTAVTVEGRTYEVQSDSIPLLKGWTNSEVTFTLAGPVAVLR
jgi:hypothetical protein